MMQPDPFVKARADAQNAVATFLPSLTAGPQAPPAPPPQIPPKLMESVRALSLARHVENMAARVARGLPPTAPPPPSPQETFAAELDPVHIRALTAAIEAHPEDQRAALIHEAHENIVKWIAAHNGQVIIDGKMQLAHSPQSAEVLGAKIINDAVDDHDQRKADEAQAAMDANAPTEARGSTEAQPKSQPQSKTGPELQPAPSSINPAPAPAIAEPASASPSPVSAVQPSQNSTTPEVIPPAGSGQIEPQGPAPEVQPDEAAKVGTTEDGEQITQPKNSVPANQKLAMDAAPELHQALTTLTSQIPGTSYARIRPQKDDGRLDQKVDDGKDPDTLSDFLAAQVSADSPAAKDKMIAALKKSFPVIDVDDKFLEGRQDKAGYPSANAQVQLSNGSSAEVQIVPKEVQDVTDQSHAHYKAGREAEQNGDNETRDKEWAQAKQIHASALDAFKARNGLRSQIATSNSGDKIRQSLEAAGFKTTGDPISLGGKLFVGIHQPEVESGDDQESQVERPLSLPGESSDVPIDGGEQRTQSGDSGVREDQGTGSDKLGRAAAGPLGKGQTVQLPDGSQGEVKFIHPTLNKARVSVGGKMLEVKKSDLQVAS